jgi:hypothetical protein
MPRDKPGSILFDTEKYAGRKRPEKRNARKGDSVQANSSGGMMFPASPWSPLSSVPILQLEETFQERL